MDNRKRLFDIICDIQFSIVYGNLYACRCENIQRVITAFFLFVTSSTFISFWIWDNHSNLLGTALFILSFLQILRNQFDNSKAIASIESAVANLRLLYDDALKQWFELESKECSDDEYKLLAESFRQKETALLSLSNKYVNFNQRIKKQADELADAHIRYDFNF